MFGAAPSANRDGSLGVNVIQDYGQGGAFTGGNLVLGFDSQLPGTFDSTHGAIKQNNFAVQRSGYFHYVLMAHRYAGGSSSSGFAELPGDDSIVTLYCFNSDTNVANTIAHELGHNFGLDHGGSVACNGKPNYNSVMNYRFQFPGVDTNCDTYGDGVLDYSRGTRISLNESNLNEFVGICGSPSLDWNGDGFLQSSVAWDLNPEYVNSCPGPFSALDDHNDWGAVQLNVAAMAAMGASIPSQTVTCPPPPGG